MKSDAFSFFYILIPLVLAIGVYVLFVFRNKIYRKLAYIEISDQAIPLEITLDDGNHQTIISPQNLGKELGFKYIHFPRMLAIQRHSQFNTHETSPEIAAFIKRNQPFRFLVKKQNDRVGYAVYTQEDIPANIIISFYPGEYLPNYDSNKQDRYCYQIAQDTAPSFRCSARDYGSIARLIQDLPYPKTLEDRYYLNGINPDDIATANLKPEMGDYCGIKVIYLKSIRDIKAGELLGYQYSPDDNYWHQLMLNISTESDRNLFYRSNYSEVESQHYLRQYYILPWSNIICFLNIKSLQLARDKQCDFYIFDLKSHRCAIPSYEYENPELNHKYDLENLRRVDTASLKKIEKLIKNNYGVL